MKEEFALAIGFVVAGLGPLAVASVLIPLREQSPSTSIVVLAMVVAIAAAAALAGPAAAVFATVTATMAFDFLYIRPDLALKLDPKDDRWPLILLLAVGLAIVVITRRRWSWVSGTPASQTARPGPSRHIQRIVHLIEQGADPRDLISAVQAELTALLLARSCRFDGTEDTVGRPRLRRDGSVAGRPVEPTLPPEELEIAVGLGTKPRGRFVIEPTPGAVVPFDHRIVAVVLTDHLAAAISSKPAVPPVA